MAKRIVTALCLCFILVGCAFARPARAEKVMRFGVNPWAAEDVMRKSFKPLMDYLHEQLGIRFDIVITSNYEELIKRTSSGDINLASFNAVAFLMARHQGLPLQYLATALKPGANGQPGHDYYSGYIIVKKDSPYKTLDDLRGKVFAFVDTESASGYKMPVAFLATTGRGSPDEFFKKYFYMGNHDEVASAVYYGCVDGGATSENSYADNTAKQRFGDAFRIIENITPIPNDAWVVSPDTRPELAQKIKDLLLSIHQDTRTADGRIVLNRKLGFPGVGWSERSPEFYEKQASLLLYDVGK